MERIKTLLFIGGLLILIYVLLKKSKFMDKQISKNFYLSEFTKTGTGLPNIPTPNATKNIEGLVNEVLQPLRDYLKLPIIVTSGYRSPMVNAAIGGVSTSDHSTGNAADIKVNGLSNEQIINAIKRLELPVKQVIDEQLYNASGGRAEWVHIAHKKGENKGEFLTARNTPTDLKTKYSYG